MVTATKSSKTPRVKKTRILGVTILNLTTAIMPIPYDNNEREIIKAPKTASKFILFTFYFIQI
jgi:hypothetical protein